MKRIVLLFLALCCAPLQAQDLSKILARVPEGANVLTVVDTKGLMKTQKANMEGWAQSRNLDYLSGKLAFPPSATFVVVAADYNPIEQRNDWQIGLFEFPGKVYEDQIAKREGSGVELIENLYVIPSRRNMYFVQFDRENYGIFAPANRAKMINWVQYAKSNTTNKVSDYLTNAVINGGSNGQINIAIQLKNSLDRVEVTKRLQASKAVTDSGADRVKLADLIVGIQGLRLSINVTTGSVAQVSVDFKDNVEPFAKALPGLLIETLERNGFSMGDVSQLQTTTRGRTLTLRGPIDDDDVKRILHQVLPRTFEPAVTSNQTGEAAMASTSQAYFRAVDNLLKDLRTRSDRLDRGRNWNTNASWYEYTAQKIDSLPVVNTDEQLLQYSADVAAQLRICGESLRGVNITNRVLDTYKRGGSGFGVDAGMGWGGWGGGVGVVGLGGFGYSSNVQQVESSKAETAAAGAKDRNAIWVKIGDQTTAIRSEMAKKYRIEF